MILIDKDRRTGRTTRALQAALKVAAAGNDVMFAVASPRMKDHVFHMLAGYEDARILKLTKKPKMLATMESGSLEIVHFEGIRGRRGVVTVDHDVWDQCDGTQLAELLANMERTKQ